MPRITIDLLLQFTETTKAYVPVILVTSSQTIRGSLISKSTFDRLSLVALEASVEVYGEDGFPISIKDGLEEAIRPDTKDTCVHISLPSITTNGSEEFQLPLMALEREKIIGWSLA